MKLKYISKSPGKLLKPRGPTEKSIYIIMPLNTLSKH